MSNNKSSLNEKLAELYIFLDVSEEFRVTDNISFSQNIDSVSSDSDNEDLQVQKECNVEVFPHNPDCSQAQYDLSQSNNTIRGTEWLKKLESRSNAGSKCPSRESSQISTTSESPSENVFDNLDLNRDDTRKREIWDSSKKRKAKKGGVAEKWEDMIKNELSDRALKEHFKEKDSVMGISFNGDLVPLSATIINYEIGFDSLVRFRCRRDTSGRAQGTNRLFASVSEIFEVILNKDELNGIDVSRAIHKIELRKPFVEVQINDYWDNRHMKPLTVITNPSVVNVA